MDAKYVKLFTEIARTISVLSESVMDYNKGQNDDKAYEASETMRNEYTNLWHKLEDNPDAKLSRAEYAKTYIGALIIVEQIESRIKKDKIALDGYKADLIPKLEQVVNQTKSDIDAAKLGEKIFQIGK